VADLETYKKKGLKSSSNKILGLLKSWAILCPVEKDQLKAVMERLQEEAKMVLWLPYTTRGVT
jgi:hypothetical protein